MYSGETHPDGRFVTKVVADAFHVAARAGVGRQRQRRAWVAAIHPDDRAALRGALQLRERAPAAPARARVPPVWLRRRRALGVGADLPAPPARGRRRRHRRRGRRCDGTARGHARTQRSLRASRARARRSGRVRRLLRGGGRAHRLDASGPGVERMLGGPLPEDSDGPTIWYECVHPDDRAMLDAYFERLAMREPAEATYRLRGLDGVERWVWSRAMPHPGDGPVGLRRGDHRRHRARARSHRPAARPRGGRAALPRRPDDRALQPAPPPRRGAPRAGARPARAHQPRARAARRRPPARAQRAARARRRRRGAARAGGPALAQRAHLRHDLAHRRRPLRGARPRPARR